VGLRRYARIFQRKDAKEKNEQLDIPVACVTDMDVMPDCAPVIIGKLKEGDEWPAPKPRRWKAKRDFRGEEALAAHRNEMDAKASGQYVKTFISNEWTLEYDLALGPKDGNGTFAGGLTEDVFVAACLAEEDDAINAKREKTEDVERTALEDFAALKSAAAMKDGCTAEEVLASEVYAKFAKDGVSKAIAAQYLANRLQCKRKTGHLTCDGLRRRLPTYLVNAIDYVTGGKVTESDHK
jgi:putative ATP-dependent endonuclease of OLD family